MIKVMTQKVFIIFNMDISEVSSVLWMHCSLKKQTCNCFLKCVYCHEQVNFL